MCVWRDKIGKEAKKERDCRKPLAPCLQSAICWWRSSWRGGAQRPFLAMRSSLINKTKSQLCHSNLLSAPMLKDTVYLHIIQSLWMRAYRHIGVHSWSQAMMELLHKQGRGIPQVLITEGMWKENYVQVCDRGGTARRRSACHVSQWAGSISWREESATKLRAKIKWLICFWVQKCQHEMTSFLHSPQCCCCLVTSVLPPQSFLFFFSLHVLTPITSTLFSPYSTFFIQYMYIFFWTPAFLVDVICSSCQNRVSCLFNCTIKWVAGSTMPCWKDS